MLTARTALPFGNLLFSSGKTPLTASDDMAAGGIEEQTAQARANLKAVVDAAGANSNDVIKTTVSLSDLAQFAAFDAVYDKLFEGHRPARSTVQVARLPN